MSQINAKTPQAEPVKPATTAEKQDALATYHKELQLQAARAKDLPKYSMMLNNAASEKISIENQNKADALRLKELDQIERDADEKNDVCLVLAGYAVEIARGNMTNQQKLENTVQSKTFVELRQLLSVARQEDIARLDDLHLKAIAMVFRHGKIMENQYVVNAFREQMRDGRTDLLRTIQDMDDRKLKLHLVDVNTLAGRKLTFRVCDRQLENERHVRAVLFPEFTPPDSYWEADFL